MARVYSWVVSNSPTQYAYIVKPNDYNSVYIGEQLTDSDLQSVANWASTCTDAEYNTQFEKVKQLCEDRNYDVSFESVEAYSNVSQPCDNLRGPAGRGILEIRLTASDEIKQTDTYTIYYDDNSTPSTFTINHGKPGRDGIDGKPGAKGDTPVASIFKMIYASGSDSSGNLITHEENGKIVPGPETPKGGNFDFLTYTFEAPDGWGTNDSELLPPVWMSSRTFTNSTASTDNNWSKPAQITGENGKPGEDGLNSEFIYVLSKTQPDTPKDSENIAGFVPQGWEPSPQGVDEDNTTEWSCIRRLTKKKDDNGQEIKEWSKWETPTIWSKYGINGQDGDGVQYMYLRNKGQVPKNPTPAGYNVSGETIVNGITQSYYDAYQNKDTEWLPPVNTAYYNYKGDLVTFKPFEGSDIAVTGETDENGNTIYPPGIWTDNPTDVNVEFQYQWVCTRKYKTITKKVGDKEIKVKEWDAYSNPALWGKFGEQGQSGTVIRKLYALTQNTSTVPIVPGNSVITGEWSSGFPKDYVNGENVVWGTEAELWVHDNTFVSNYMLVSSFDDKGNVIKPDGIITEEDKKNDSSITALTNCIVLAYVPNEKYTDENGISYQYVCSEKQYYEWRKGGWCEPYLVSGLKGEDASPNDYVTIAFGYGYEDFIPETPTFSNPITLGTTGSIDAPQGVDSVKWYDYPDTSGGKIDGALDNKNYKRRWYQCQGYVDGQTGEIKLKDGIRQWGQVFPNSPRDGESIKGKFMETRFAVTAGETAPTIEQKINGVPNRNPLYLNDEGIPYGWFSTGANIPKIPTGGAMWSIFSWVDGETDTLIETDGKYWNGPTRISGERGEQGLPGPTGLRGTTGIPGASQNSLYCLGTESYLEDNYYFRDSSDDRFETRLILSGMSSGYFGYDVYNDGVRTTETEIKDWYDGSDMPYSTPSEIEVVIDSDKAKEWDLTEQNVSKASEKDGNDYYYKKINTDEIYKTCRNTISASTSYENVLNGSVFKAIITVSETMTHATYIKTYHQYYLKTKDHNNKNQSILRHLTRILTTKESELFSIYVWGIQGNSIVTKGISGKYKVNEDVAFYKQENGVFTGNTKTVTKLPDPYTKDDDGNYIYQTSNSKPQDYIDAKYLYLKTTNTFYKWGYENDSDGKMVFRNIKTTPNVVDSNNAKFLSDLTLNAEEYLNGLPKDKVVDENNHKTYDYVIDDNDGTIGLSDCYKWEEFDGEAVIHGITGVKWGIPFKLQGTNGLRGITGTRGQVVYPMGEYNNEEVYITTAEKAPYVYDPNDSLFYVLDIVDTPWVGLLPRISGGTDYDLSYYKSVTTAPADSNGNFKTYEGYYPGKAESIDENGEVKWETKPKNDPLTMNEKMVSAHTITVNGVERVVKYIFIKNYRDLTNKETVEGQLGGKYLDNKYGRIIEAYFEWIDEGEGKGHYTISSPYKYKFNGYWISDQDGGVPSLHYANSIEDNRTPLWTRFETFQALYTSVGIIANGLIGSAVFNNEFMFSQQGKDFAENKTEYKTVSSAGYDYGFLSGYRYDEKGVEINNKIYHWRYDGGPYYLSEEEVDPYQKVKYGNNSGDIINQNNLDFAYSSNEKYVIMKPENAEEIASIPDTHKGINKSGEVCYINVHPVNTSGASENYLHTFMPNVCINFATGQMWLSTGQLKFGFNEKNILTTSEVERSIQNTSDYLSEQISSETTTIKSIIETTKKDLITQIDQKAETHYGSTNPANGWSETDREIHIGDMWYNTGDYNEKDHPYNKNCTYRYNKSGNTYVWEYQDIPASVFDQIDGKSAIFVSKPTGDADCDGFLYKENDMWLLETNYTDNNELGETGVEGSIWVSTASTSTEFSFSDWVKKGTELDNWVSGDFSKTINEVSTQIDKKADCYYQPTDPSDNWQNSESGATSTYAPYRIGDIWYDSRNNKSYTYSDQTGTTSNLNVASYINAKPSGYYWVESNVPEGVFDRLDGKSSIYVSKPESDPDGDGYLYHEGDMWLSGNTKNGGDGEIMRATTSRIKDDGFKEEDWVKASMYTDDTMASQAIGRLNGFASDDYVSPSEQGILRDEKFKIQNEYNSLTATCSIYGMTDKSASGYNAYTAYTDSYTRAYNTLIYYSGDAPYNKYPSGDYKTGTTQTADTYYNCIKISSTGTSTGTPTVYKYYGDIANYYVKKQDLQNAIVSKAKESAIAEAQNFTTGQINAISGTVSSIKTTIEGQLDKKADTYVSDKNPATDWTTTAICETHKGDMWYDTSKSKSYIFSDSKTNAAEYITGKTISNKTYYWVVADVPLSIYDYADSKSSIWYDQSPTGYTIRDMWFVPSNQSGLTNVLYGTGDTVICTAITSGSTNAHGITTATGFTKTDWVKLDKYTDDTKAQTALDNAKTASEAAKAANEIAAQAKKEAASASTILSAWSQDGHLSPTERKELKYVAEKINAESGYTYRQLINYTTYSVAENFAKWAKYAYDAARYYYSGGSDLIIGTYSGITISTNIQDTVEIIGNTYDCINKYYDEKEKAYTAITNSVNEKAEDAQSAVTDAQKLVTLFGGTALETTQAILGGYLGVKGKSGVTSMINGSDEITNVSGEQIVMALGMEDTVLSVTTFKKYVAFNDLGDHVVDYIPWRKIKEYEGVKITSESHSYYHDNKERDVFYANVDSTVMFSEKYKEKSLVLIQRQEYDRDNKSFVSNFTPRTLSIKELDNNYYQYVYLAYRTGGTESDDMNWLILKYDNSLPTINGKYQWVDLYKTPKKIWLLDYDNSDDLCRNLGFDDGIGGDIEEHDTKDGKTVKIIPKGSTTGYTVIASFILMHLSSDDIGNPLFLYQQKPNRGNGNYAFYQWTGTNSRKYPKEICAKTQILYNGKIIAKDIELDIGTFKGTINADGVFSGNVITDGIIDASNIKTGHISSSYASSSNLKTSMLSVTNNLDIGNVNINAHSFNFNTGLSRTTETFSSYATTIKETNTEKKTDKTYNDFYEIFNSKLNGNFQQVDIPNIGIYVYNKNTLKNNNNYTRKYKLYYKIDNNERVLISTLTFSNYVKHDYYREDNGVFKATSIKLNSGTTIGTFKLEIGIDIQLFHKDIYGNCSYFSGTLNNSPQSLIFHYPTTPNFVAIAPNAIVFKNDKVLFTLANTGLTATYGGKGLLIDASGGKFI